MVSWLMGRLRCEATQELRQDQCGRAPDLVVANGEEGDMEETPAQGTELTVNDTVVRKRVKWDFEQRGDFLGRRIERRTLGRESDIRRDAEVADGNPDSR